MNEAFYKFDPIAETGLEIPEANRREALEAAANFVKEQILLYSAEGKTSVAGGNWKKKLSDGYEHKKEEESSADFANLELTGAMMDALETRVQGGMVVVEVGGDQAAKAEGNLLGTYGRSSPHPEQAREFMPHRNGQQFRREIIAGLRGVLEDYVDPDA